MSDDCSDDFMLMIGANSQPRARLTSRTVKDDPYEGGGGEGGQHARRKDARGKDDEGKDSMMILQDVEMGPHIAERVCHRQVHELPAVQQHSAAKGSACIRLTRSDSVSSLIHDCVL